MFVQGAAGRREGRLQGLHGLAVIHLMIERRIDPGHHARRQMRLPLLRLFPRQPFHIQPQRTMIVVIEAQAFGVVTVECHHQRPFVAIVHRQA